MLFHFVLPVNTSTNNNNNNNNTNLENMSKESRQIAYRIFI